MYPTLCSSSKNFIKVGDWARVARSVFPDVVSFVVSGRDVPACRGWRFGISQIFTRSPSVGAANVHEAKYLRTASSP